MDCKEKNSALSKYFSFEGNKHGKILCLALYSDDDILFIGLPSACHVLRDLTLSSKTV